MWDPLLRELAVAFLSALGVEEAILVAEPVSVDVARLSVSFTEPSGDTIALMMVVEKYPTGSGEGGCS